jgi:hypothetical protein
MTVVRFYDESKNPEHDRRFISGVPLRDLTEDEFEQLPKHLQRSVDAADFYRKTKPRDELAKERES